jgi:hypothetical protein
MREIAILCVLTVLPLAGQRIETQKPDRNKVVRVETAMNHLTVIEVTEPVTMAAAGSPAYRIERRENKVFIEPLEEGVSTNLFLWTSSTRLSYELVPATSVERMHFAIDQQLPETPVAQLRSAPLITPVGDGAPKAALGPTLLLESDPVRVMGMIGAEDRVGVVIRDVYRNGGELFIRYAIQNGSKAVYEPGTPRAYALTAPRSTTSLYSLSNTQLGAPYDAKLRSKGRTALEVVRSELQSDRVMPGKHAVGVVSIKLPQDATAPAVLRLSFQSDLAATLVL